MKKPAHHIFVCASFRMSGAPQGVCSKKGAGSLLQYLETELSDRGLQDVNVSMTGCLKVCDKGPVMVVYPEGYWYGEVNEEKVDAILDALENGESVDEYRIDK
ncbi:MAG TPA: (2Fe-2S) ferredoxin domain-containing protein [Chitinispirillaceae bacterium]|nr:(2Fe-2S) ferredoxin domain-containing protein [Chitinispirillaceae bacterium]